MTHEAFVRDIASRIEKAKSEGAQGIEHRHVIVLIGGVRYAIPMRSVIEVVRTPALTLIPGAPVYIQGVFFHRGAIVPVIDIPKRFQSGKVALRVPEHVILIEDAGIPYGFLVERVIDAIECFPETLQQIHEGGERLPAPYVLGFWEHKVLSHEPRFRYDFLIAGHELRTARKEDEGERYLTVQTYLISIHRMIEALNNDAVSSMIQ